MIDWLDHEGGMRKRRGGLLVQIRYSNGDEEGRGWSGMGRYSISVDDACSPLNYYYQARNRPHRQRSGQVTNQSGTSVIGRGNNQADWTLFENKKSEP